MEAGGRHAQDISIEIDMVRGERVLESQIMTGTLPVDVGHVDGAEGGQAAEQVVGHLCELISGQVDGLQSRVGGEHPAGQIDQVGVIHGDRHHGSQGREEAGGQLPRGQLGVLYRESSDRTRDVR